MAPPALRRERWSRSTRIQPETRRTLENIRATLERHGSSLDRVVKRAVFLADVDEWPAMNEVCVACFPEDLPARSASGLALGSRAEIEAIAVVGRRGPRIGASVVGPFSSAGRIPIQRRPAIADPLSGTAFRRRPHRMGRHGESRVDRQPQLPAA